MYKLYMYADRASHVNVSKQGTRYVGLDRGWQLTKTYTDTDKGTATRHKALMDAMGYRTRLDVSN